MIVLALIEVEDDLVPETWNDVEMAERKRREQIHDDIHGCLNHAATYTLVRLDVAGVDGVTVQSIKREIGETK